MPELSQIYQKQLDSSQFCPVCQAAMYWIEGDIYGKDIQFFECSSCQHCIFFGEQPFSCHCVHCEKERKKLIKQSQREERQEAWLKKHKTADDDEFLLDDLSLLDKLFLLSLLEHTISNTPNHDEYLYLKFIQKQHIVPSYQLCKKLKNHFISMDYLRSFNPEIEQYYPHIRLLGYREPSLSALYQQLEAWFYRDFAQGVPYKDNDEVKDVLITILVHELVNYCQYCCEKWHVLFYADQKLLDYFAELLQHLAVTQIFYLIDKALNYLASQRHLDKANKNYKNTNFLRATLQQYRERGINEQWETGNLPRPADLPLSLMSYIFLYRFLKFEERAFVQPIWKSWQDIIPRLRFFTERHCVHCGSKDLNIEYNTKDSVSFTCLHCKRQDHYFIK